LGTTVRRLRTRLVATAAFTSQVRVRSGVIVSAKPKPVVDMQSAARNAIPTAAAMISADNR
jgi:hypothetical protein